MRTKLLFLFLILSGPLSQAAPVKSLSEMSPEHCAEFPPEQLYQQLVAVEPQIHGIGSSAGYQDNFCAVYQRQLQKFVDAKYPRAREYRKPLTDAFLTMVHYIEEIYGRNMIKHLYERTPAEVEWIICQAEKNNYKLWRETDYDAVAIERLALIMADGSGRGLQFEQQALPLLHQSLRHFAAATKDKDGESFRHRRAYLAHALIKFLTGLI